MIFAPTVRCPADRAGGRDRENRAILRNEAKVDVAGVGKMEEYGPRMVPEANRARIGFCETKPTTRNPSQIRMFKPFMTGLRTAAGLETGREGTDPATGWAGLPVPDGRSSVAGKP